MSIGLGGQGGQPAPSVTCRVCGTVVPLGAFCGFCGAQLSSQRGNGPDWLRIRAYAAAPGEHLLRLSVVSSLFPHLPHRSRAAFRAGLAALIIALVAVAVLRWQAPLIALSALGFPALFLIYLHESDVYDDLPVRALLVTAVAGAGLGAGWALLTGPVVARSYPTGVGLGLAGERVLRDGLAIPLGGAVLMLVPAVLVRVLRPPTRESLDGPVVGEPPPIGLPAPPPGPPVQSYPRFTPGDGGFSVDYPADLPQGPNGPLTLIDNGVVLQPNGPDKAPLAQLIGQPAGDRTPRQIAQDLIQDHFPGATVAYQIPNAMVGYQPGYGEFDDYFGQNSFSSSIHLRVMTMVAVKDGLALIAFAYGPYVDFTQPMVGHPSGANLRIADFIGPFVNSFSWRGDPAR